MPSLASTFLIKKFLINELGCRDLRRGRSGAGQGPAPKSVLAGAMAHALFGLGPGPGQMALSLIHI